MKTHKDLIVWQKSIDFVVVIYETTKSYPKEENFSLVSQMKRASTSIPANIAEGSGRRSTKEFIQFLHIALGSASELETFIIISNKLDFISDATSNKLIEQNSEIIRMLSALIKSLQDS